MRILLCLHDFLPEHVGGTEVHVAAVGRELQRRGHDVTVLFSERREDRPEGELTAGEHPGLPTLEACHRREYARLADTWLEPRARVVFEGLIERLRPDICHFHHTATWGAGCLASARRAGARVFFTAHDYHLLCDSGRLLRADGSLCRAGDGTAHGGGCGECLARHPGLARGSSAAAPDAASAAGLRALFQREMLASAERVLTPSQFAADLFAGAGLVEAERLEVLANGLCSPVSPRAPRTTDPAAPLCVGFVGGLFPDKGAHVLLEALRAVPDVALELHVHGVLDWFPDYVARLKELAGADGRVHFHGRFDPADAERVFGSLDLLAAPSLWYENAPLVVDEAFARRVPVVASDLGGLAECVEEGGSGRLVPPGDALALGAVLRELAGDRAALGRLAAGTPPVPTLDAHADRLEELYRASSSG